MEQTLTFEYVDTRICEETDTKMTATDGASGDSPKAHYGSEFFTFWLTVFSIENCGLALPIA